MKKNRIWLVGASQGIGLALVKHFLKQGHKVIASSRHAENEADLLVLQVEYAEQLVCLNIDVNDQQDCEIKAAQAWSMFDGLDWWFYNVGLYQPMRIVEWNWKSFVQMNQANYLGVVALMMALQQKFAQQGHGRWIWNASLAGYFGLPYGGGYSAPKAAMINLAESLQPELAAQGIQLQIINHGVVRTRLTAKNQFEMPGLLEPEQAAAQISHALHTSSAFEIRFPFKLRAILSLLKVMPYRLSLALTRKMLRD